MANNIKLILSPLAGVTDRAFREICDPFADYAYTEMVSVKGLFHSDRITEELLAKFDGEDKLGLQIFGSDPELIKVVVKDLLKQKPYFQSIDLNMGCPARKIVKNGEGSALMKEPELVKRLISTLKETTDLPISAKFRLGFDEDSKNYLEIGQICQDYGASSVTLHARTREQMYSGKADWTAIKELKEHLSIKVVGNGDIFTPEDAKAMIEETGVDQIAIGRGAMGNPYLFKQIKDYLEKGTYQTVTIDDVLDMIEKHYKLSIKYKGERLAVKQMRKHVAWYIKGFRGSNALKNRINETKDIQAVFALLEDYRQELKNV